MPFPPPQTKKTQKEVEGRPLPPKKKHGKKQLPLFGRAAGLLASSWFTMVANSMSRESSARGNRGVGLGMLVLVSPGFCASDQFGCQQKGVSFESIWMSKKSGLLLAPREKCGVKFDLDSLKAACSLGEGECYRNFCPPCLGVFPINTHCHVKIGNSIW